MKELILKIIGHAFHYEMENLCRIFYPNDKIEKVYEQAETACDERTVETFMNKTQVSVLCRIDGASACRKAQREQGGDDELLMAQLLFACLVEITGYRPSWGIVTGVRPSKLMIKLENEYGKQGARDYFSNQLLVNDEKTNLTCSVAEAESKIISLSKPESYSLYVSIPFCPSRCSYCSFVSHSISNANAKRLVPQYLEKLLEELEITGAIASELGLKLESIYFGGGTPSVLEASQLDALLTQIENHFDLSHLREYTVECGRPDTVTVQKLRTLKNHNVGRISINPQTFSQQVLDVIGRNHSVEQAVSAYKLARSLGFESINMDLIAGLESDTYEGFCESVDTAVTLAPDNITIHSLALKRSSQMVADGAQVADGNEAAKMLAYAQQRLTGAKYEPYYMYRQSKCVGNLENVGWAKQGKECLYNVFMMEECHTVLAVGAGAVTRLKQPEGDYIERIFNFKYPYEYISRFDELVQRKSRINSFYSSY